jgi:hypothetical protein
MSEMGLYVPTDRRSIQRLTASRLDVECAPNSFHRNQGTGQPLSRRGREAKHGADITNLFQISTTRDKSTIVIRFHDGKGDFGTVNGATVTIPAKAFAAPFDKDELVLQIATDIPKADE